MTHGHEDHYGSAAEIRSWHGAPVHAHAADAPVIRGEAPRAEPVLTDFDSPIRAQVLAAGDRMLEGFRRLAALDTDTACFGHGDPVVGDAGAALRYAADTHRRRRPV